MRQIGFWGEEENHQVGGNHGEPWWRDNMHNNNAIGFRPNIYEPPKPKLDPKIQSQIESQKIKLHAGFTGDPFELDLQGKTQAYFTQGDGMYAMVDRPFAKIMTRQNEEHYPGEPVGLITGFRLKIPKLPYKLFAQILAFFRHYVIDLGYNGVTEAMVWVYYDTRNSEYFIEVPVQEVSGGGVQYKFEGQNPRCKETGVYKVFDIHSHNTMSAFFSGIDDRDEKGQQFYGVIGSITKDTYALGLRAGINGFYHACVYDDLIEQKGEQEEEVTEYPQEWIFKVTLPKPYVFEPTITTYTGPGIGHSYELGDDGWGTGRGVVVERNNHKKFRKFTKNHTAKASDTLNRKFISISDRCLSLAMAIEDSGESITDFIDWLSNNEKRYEQIYYLHELLEQIFEDAVVPVDDPTGI